MQRRELDAGSPPEYKTSDIHLAAFLKTIGIRMLKTERAPQNHGRVVFVFEKTQDVEALQMSYWNRQSKVDALTFADNLKSLKTLVHMA